MAQQHYVRKKAVSRKNHPLNELDSLRVEGIFVFIHSVCRTYIEKLLIYPANLQYNFHESTATASDSKKSTLTFVVSI